MGNRIRSSAVLFAALAVVAGLTAVVALAENIDPGSDGSQYAWGENVGWINAEPANCSDCGVEVADTELTGWMWGENVGWINLNCSNNGTCGFVNYGVTNDGAGDLAGYAWGENVGWISFSCDNTSSCGFVDYGVTIDTVTGEFSGYAWGENIGWISFSCENQSTCGIVNYGVQTSWTAAACDTANPAADTDADLLTNGVETDTGVFVDASNTGTDPCVVDTDTDGCADGEEVLNPKNLGGSRDPNNPRDFYDITDISGVLSSKDKGISGFDLNLLLAWGGAMTGMGPNGNGKDYDVDGNAPLAPPQPNTTPDGDELDFAGIGGAGTGPDGGISGFDLNQMLSEGGDNCTAAP